MLTSVNEEVPWASDWGACSSSRLSASRKRAVSHTDVAGTHAARRVETTAPPPEV